MAALKTLQRTLPLLGMTITAACASAPPPPPGDYAPRFSPLDFFVGRTEGEGVLKVIFSPRRRVQVHGRGRLGPDGALILDQTVVGQSRPARQRQWRIREIAPDRFSGTLSDAAGPRPVTGEVLGGRLHLRFRMKGGLDADQWLDLAPGGEAARNHMMIRRLGVVVASLDETIRRTGADPSGQAEPH